MSKSNPIKARKRYHVRIHSGICTCCGLPNDRPNRVRCSVCAAKQAERDAVNYARNGQRKRAVNATP